jgi:hypothetical protein
MEALVDPGPRRHDYHNIWEFHWFHISSAATAASFSAQSPDLICAFLVFYIFRYVLLLFSCFSCHASLRHFYLWVCFSILVLSIQLL